MRQRSADRAKRPAGAWVVLRQVVRDLRAANAAEWAAALACYSVLSLFPLLLAGVAIASIVGDRGWAEDRLVALLGQALPGGAVDVEGLVAEAVSDRRRVGVLSVVVFLFTGRRVLGALTKALNLVSDVDESSDPAKRRILVELALLLGLAALLVLALAARPLLDLLWATVASGPAPGDTARTVVDEGLRILLTFATFAAVYAVVPQGRRRWQAVVVGAVVATVLFSLARLGFGLALGTFWENLQLVYGPLAVAALLLVWGWYVALITLVGASLASHVKTMVVEGLHPAATERRHVPGKGGGP